MFKCLQLRKVRFKWVPRELFGLKAENSINRITLNPSSASSEETLYLGIPKLSENVVIVPGSIKLRFDLNVEGHANNTVINNLGCSLITRLKITFCGETLQDCQRYELLKTYCHNFGSDRLYELYCSVASVNHQGVAIRTLLEYFNNNWSSMTIHKRWKLKTNSNGYLCLNSNKIQ